MDKLKNNRFVIGGVTLLIVILGTFLLLQPSAKDILQKTLETSKTINSGHFIAELEFTTPEQKGAGKIELWAQHDEGSGMFRMEVLESSREEANGAVIVSDGETLWAYSPDQNKVYTGTLDEAKVAFAEKQSRMEDFDFDMEKFDFDKDDFEHPKDSEEAIEMLFEYVDAKKAGSETIANSSAYHIELKPISEKVPAEYSLIGGIINLWIDKSRSIPLGLSYSGGALGEFSVKAVEAEINQSIDKAIFTFDIPADAEIVQLVDLIPESLSLEEAIESAEFEILVLEDLPEGATLVDVITVQDVVVQRFTFEDGGSFSVNQGVNVEIPNPPTEMETVTVRGVIGDLFVSKDKDRVLLSWVEGEVHFFVAGDITAEQAISIAESLK